MRKKTLVRSIIKPPSMTYIEDKTEPELVDDIGGTVIGTQSGLKAQFAQAELTRRLIVSIGSLDRSTSFYSKIIILLTVFLGIFAFIQIWFAIKQTNYAERQTTLTEIQSIPERINQARSVTESVERCKKSPELEKSGLYNIKTWEPAPCSEVLQMYKN